MLNSAANTMAQSIKRLYKDVQFGVGPTIEDGFYYDIDMDKSLTPEDLEDIEREMKRIVDSNLPIERIDRKSTRLNSSHVSSSYAVFSLKTEICYTEYI